MCLRTPLISVTPTGLILMSWRSTRRGFRRLKEVRKKLIVGTSGGRKKGGGRLFMLPEHNMNVFLFYGTYYE